MEHNNRGEEIDQNLIDEFNKSPSLFNSDMIRMAMSGVIAVLLFIAGTSILAKNDNSGLTKGQVDDIFVEVNYAFNKAESEILNDLPDPDPDPEPLGPDPDPEKCVCGGTGIITHGDGHTTDCPYHKQEEETNRCKKGCKKNCKKSCNCGANENKGFIQQVSSEKVVDEKEAVKKNYRYKLYVFSAEFCGPCKQMNRNVWQNLVDPKTYTQESHKSIKLFLERSNIKFEQYIWEKDKPFFKKNKVNSFPTMILVRDEKIVMRSIGYKGKDAVKFLINSKISKGR